MGINYYFTSKPCETCGRFDSEENLHIGKSSSGWCFALHVYPEKNINDIDDWYKKFISSENKIIRTEYGEIVSIDHMLLIITARFKFIGKQIKISNDWYSQNNAEPGPFGLVRSKVKNSSGPISTYQGCIGHGIGTYDLIVGDFS